MSDQSEINILKKEIERLKNELFKSKGKAAELRMKLRTTELCLKARDAIIPPNK